MDVLLLSRLQFAAATFFHFLFVPLTLGLSVITAIMETIYVRTGDEDYYRAARFWGKILLVNFAVGVVTGITLEFQFGTNWSRYSPLCGGHFRVPAGHRGDPGIFPGIDLPGGLGLRLEAPLPQGPCHLHLAGGHRLQPFGPVDPHRQCLDAAPGGLCLQERAGRTGQFPGGSHPTLRLADFLPRHQRGLHPVGLCGHGDQRLSPAAQAAHRIFHQVVPGRPDHGPDFFLCGGHPGGHSCLRGSQDPAG